MHIPIFTYKPVASHKWGISSGDAMTDEVGVGGEDFLTTKEHPCHVFSDSIHSKQIINIQQTMAPKS